MLPKPAACDGEIETGFVLGRATLMLCRNGQLISSIWMRPSGTGSTELAISISLRAAASGSAKGRGWINFIMLFNSCCSQLCESNSSASGLE